jgi:hypothetical protein
MPQTEISAQSIAAFEQAMSSLKKQSSIGFGLQSTLGGESAVLEDRYADIENAISREHCINGLWDKGWRLVAKQLEAKGISRARWETQMLDAIRADSMLHTLPM